jgi:hypothetical protein
LIYFLKLIRKVYYLFNYRNLFVKKIFATLVLCTFGTSAFATTCPPISAWSHVKGQPWILNAADGWKAVDDGNAAINSDKTSLDKFTDVSAHVTQTQGVWCRYFIGDYTSEGNRVLVIAQSPTSVDLSKIDHDVFTPAQDEGGGFLESICKASNPKAFNLCAW